MEDKIRAEEQNIQLLVNWLSLANSLEESLQSVNINMPEFFDQIRIELRLRIGQNATEVTKVT